MAIWMVLSWFILSHLAENRTFMRRYIHSHFGDVIVVPASLVFARTAMSQTHRLP